MDIPELGNIKKIQCTEQSVSSGKNHHLANRYIYKKLQPSLKFFIDFKKPELNHSQVSEFTVMPKGIHKRVNITMYDALCVYQNI